MTIKISSVLSFYFLVYNIICLYESTLADDEITNKGLTWWCSTTPHPDPCNYFMHQSDPKSHHDFRTMTIRAAMHQAADVQSQAAKLGSAHQVHTDCHDLIAHAILQLNTTLKTISTSPVGFAAHDAQTWLSTALTNFQLCSSAVENLKLRHPILTANVTKLISNSLATNAALLGTNETPEDSRGFPGWVTGRDRKLLQDSSWKWRASVVVAQDGSGRFESIQEAIDYAVSKRVGMGRVVVYVKKGVYTENIVVNRSMEKVMLVGDGVRHTVITSNRSASSGFTTYSSATVGN